jgi:hypothetical protein
MDIQQRKKMNIKLNQIAKNLDDTKQILIERDKELLEFLQNMLLDVRDIKLALIEKMESEK